MILGIVILGVIVIGLTVFLIIKKSKKDPPVVVPPQPGVTPKTRFYGDQYYENK